MTVEDDRIEKLKRKLYSRESFTPAADRFEINPHDVGDVKDNWDDNASLHIEDTATESGTHPFLKKFFIGAISFFLVAVSIALYMFFVGGNEVSSANVDVEIIGPTSVTSGEQIDLGLSFLNRNKTTLKDVILTVEYPDGARASEGSVEPLTRTSQNIPELAKGEAYNTTTKLYLFGDKDVSKTVVFKLEYAIAGSNARFTKEKKYTVVIGTSPLLINVSTPREINSGQQVSLQVTVTSNSSSLLKDVVVKAEYPYGFTYNNATIDPASDKQTWKLGDLKNGDKKVFTVVGTVIAQDNEERTFRFMVGVTNMQGELETVLGTAMPTISIRKPFFNTIFSIGGDVSDVVGARAKDRLSAELAMTNSLADSLSNVVLEVKMRGAALNKSGVRVNDEGFYQSTQNIILWDRNTNPDFELIKPGEKLAARFDLQDFSVPNTMKNPEIVFDVTLKGVRSLAGGGVDNVTSTASKTLRFLTDLTLKATSLRSGEFQNSGPVPPRREEPSTYTIEWVLSNTHNDVQRAQVKTTLPVYVDWMGTVLPNTESISYDPDTRTVTWNAGTIGALAGYSSSPKRVLFQVRLNPSTSQVGISPWLTDRITISGMDMFVNKTFSTQGEPVTTDTADGFSGKVQ